MKIVLTGGGTGGHLVPLVVIAKKIKEKNPEAQFLFIGPAGAMEKKIIGGAGIPMKKIATGKMRRYFSFQNLVDFFKVPFGILQVLCLLLWNMPDAIFSKGGYASVPVVLVGWLYRIPILIHESDANPGVSNSILAKFANRVAVAYSQAEIYFPAEQVVLTGNPLREDIVQGEAQKARELFSLIESKKVIFVWGGSQGSKIINDNILEVLPELLREYQVIHQTGENNLKEVKKKAGELGIKAGREGYFPLAFIEEELKDILAVSDLVISRAGSSSISEIAANRIPSILIPLENAANNHQRMNAYAIAKIGGTVVLEEANLRGHILLGKIKEILTNDEFREKLRNNVGKFYHADATEKIAEGLLGMIRD